MPTILQRILEAGAIGLPEGGGIPVLQRRWHLCASMVFVATVGIAVMLAQACGGGSAGVNVTPTATTSPTSTAGSGTPVVITSGPGAPGRALFIGGPSEEFAAFLGISLEQLQSELSAEGATPASVAEAHGRSREELKTFFLEQLQTQLSEAVAAGTMSQEEADNMLQRQASSIDDIIDGKMSLSYGGPPGTADMTPGAQGQGPFVGGASEEFAAFLGISLEQLDSELGAEGATPASVAEAHGRTREELKTFFTQQQQAQLSEAVAAGTMSQEDADQALETFTSRIDDIIDGNVAIGGGPRVGGFVLGGGGLIIGGLSEELAEFLDISLDQLETELGEEGATLASVAEAHGRTRDELKTFYADQIEAQVVEGVVKGTISPDDADAMIERLTSTIDDIIDGKMPSGGPAPTPFGR